MAPRDVATVALGVCFNYRSPTAAREATSRRWRVGWLGLF
eukprot:CAMPEP_0204282836 /NCGR_PEP_ID=MMETSP0468-20130131/44587_1 /ASSEMBLY_ACC=CAM_ASM_000383 /TAXON_ID=2969 /ORGANISM="Oxyrrhis marina" /LENGTH=39 /DNA_ID= /DNA_START= /DNA_END= /DNA_ORIENTATION=